MAKIISVEIVFQNYDLVKDGIPPHWVAIIHTDEDPFAIHEYGDSKQELERFKEGDEYGCQ